MFYYRALILIITYRYPFISTEILCSDVDVIQNKLVENEDNILQSFWDFIMLKPYKELIEYNTSLVFWSKVIAKLLERKPLEVSFDISINMTFIYS